MIDVMAIFIRLNFICYNLFGAKLQIILNICSIQTIFNTKKEDVPEKANYCVVFGIRTQ
ncbi:hypothetical protein MASR2M117_19280 [Paludibacter sp.]